MFQTKVVWFGEGHNLTLGDVRSMSHQFFFNRTSYFLFQNLIADSKNFSKHYNEVHFHYVLFEL